MNKKGPIIIIEDDLDDQLLFQEVFNNLKYPNKVIFFSDGDDALMYLRSPTESPFLIISDINMPRLNGFDLRKKLKTETQLAAKSFPYLFFTTATNQKAVIEAYGLFVQGFFVKETSIQEMEKTISAIMEYWLRCSAPNNI